MSTAAIKDKAPKANATAPRRANGGRPTAAMAAKITGHVLETAIQAFSKRGVEATSMEAIARAARVSKRTIYDRFPSKEALLSAALEHALQKNMVPIVKAPRSHDFRTSLVDLLEDVLKASIRPETIAVERLVLWARDHDPDFMRSVFEQATKVPMSFIKQFLDDQESNFTAKYDNTEVALILFDAAIVGPRQRIMHGEGVGECAETRRAHVERIVDLIFDKPSPQKNKKTRSPSSRGQTTESKNKKSRSGLKLQEEA